MKVIDMHCDTISVILRRNEELRENNNMVDLLKMKEGDYLLQCFAMFVFLKGDYDPLVKVNQMIDKYYSELSKNSDLIRPVYSYQDIIDNSNSGVMSALLTIEEGGVIKGDLAVLRNLYRLGVRMMTLTWNFENEIGYPNFQISKDGAKPDFKKPNVEKGLTDFGIEVVKEMERLGMIIDVSHLSDKGFYDVLANTTKPFVASHSNARTKCGVVRNMTDDMILKLAERGGVMGINYCDSFINDYEEKEKRYVLVQDLVDQIIYIKNLAGVDCIGLGSDFDGIDDNNEMNKASLLPMLEKSLLDNGFTIEEIEKIFYKNVLRVFKEILND